MRELSGQINIWGEVIDGKKQTAQTRNEMPVDVMNFLSVLRVARRQMPILKRTVTKDQKELINQSLIKFWKDTKSFLEE